MIKNLSDNPNLVLGRSANDLAKAFNDGGFKATVVPLKSGRGSKVLIEGHQINSIRVHEGGGRHALESVRISGNDINTKVVRGSRSNYKGNIVEEEAAGTKFIFTEGN